MNGSALIWIYVVGARAGAVGWRPDVRTLRSGLAFGLKVHGGAIAFFLLLRLDQVLVQGLVGFRALGLYSLAVTIGELLWLRLRQGERQWTERRVARHRHGLGDHLGERRGRGHPRGRGRPELLVTPDQDRAESGSRHTAILAQPRDRLWPRGLGGDALATALPARPL